MRALKKKLLEFEKKGELRPFMQSRYNTTRNLIRHLEELDGPVVVPEGEEVPPEVLPEVPRPMILKKRLKKAFAKNPLASLNFNPPPANAPHTRVPRGVYNRSGEFHVSGFVEPVHEEGVVNKPEKYGYVFKAKNRKPAGFKLTKLLTEEEAPYLQRVQHKYLPLPELYNPFTGEKYGPENDPQPNINSAHKMLGQIMERAKRDARMLKRREEKKAGAAVEL